VVVRYPDPNIKTLDPRFTPLVLGNAAVETIATGCRFTEGPVWFGDLRCLLWSDIPNDRIMRWEEETGAVSVFRRPSNYANGNTRDRQGRLVTCEMDAQRLTRTEYDGTITVLADSFEGKKLTAPNDVVVKSDGSIWFSDNGAGTRGNYLGHIAPWELPLRVYRLDPATGAMTVVVGDMKRPNGLAFSPDEKYLYVADTGATHKENGPRHIRRFAIGADGAKLSGGEVFAESTAGLFDGFRVDRNGRIWTSTAEGVHCYDGDGSLIGKILIPELVANVTFGGAKLNRLFICGTTSLYSIYVTANGSKLG